jgi:hypothetical protein
VLSNTLGLREPVYFAGSKIARVVPWVPAAGTIGMGIDIMSYNGGVTVSLQVARLIPDPETIIAGYQREVETLRQLKPAKPATRESARQPPSRPSSPPRERSARRLPRRSRGQAVRSASELGRAAGETALAQLRRGL